MFFKKIQLITIILSIVKSYSTLCLYNSKVKYQNLISQYPEYRNELNIMSNYPVPIWYTDRDSDSINVIKDTLQNCEQSTSVIIIYGLVKKDCEGHESSQGTNKNSQDYIKFITDLSSEVRDSSVIYILEPDALALSVQNKCGVNNNYLENIKNALNILSQNKNSKIYLDIGYWVLIYDDQQIKDLLEIVKSVDPEKKIKGFSLNLSNYRLDAESINSCKKIRELSGNDYKCIIDTSRNANGPSENSIWCNLKSAGIGNPPTENTGIDIIDYFLWIKPAVEIDGSCQGSDESFHSNNVAGSTDMEYFKILWNNGKLKNKSLRCENS